MPTNQGVEVPFPGLKAVVDGSELDANLDLVAAACDGVADVATAVKAIVPAPRHELVVLEVAP